MIDTLVYVQCIGYCNCQNLGIYTSIQAKMLEHLTVHKKSIATQRLLERLPRVSTCWSTFHMQYAMTARNNLKKEGLFLSEYL